MTPNIMDKSGELEATILNTPKKTMYGIGFKIL
jgi:hypothetical protein